MENNDKKQYEERNEDDGLLYGRNVVTEYLKSGKRADTLFVSTEEDAKTVSYFRALASESGAVIKMTPPAKLSRMCGSERHQGVALSAPFCEYVSIKDILNKAAEKAEAPFIVIADGIEDPHNLGAVLRTAECAGVHGVIIPKRGGVSVNSTVHRTSAGACSHIPIARVSNIASAVRELKKAGVFCYCADMDGTNCFTTDLTGSVALVIGSEGFGVSRLVKDLCDGAVSLPMFGRINSLNASAAASALIYEIVRQRTN